ncbi:MAG: HDIG domain-containing protein, partial [Treponema sp.]|nr:HDIG domain-containing protein [Treponema sp.]
MNKKNNKNSKSIFSVFFSATGDYIKKKYPFLIILFVGFAIFSFVNFLKVSTTETVASFNPLDFEIGMISDRTITATNTIPADSNFPEVSIQKGEKIVKKGFPVTKESLEKLEKMASSKVYIDFRAYANSEIYLFLIAVMWYLLTAFINSGKKVKIREIILEGIFLLMIFSAAALCGKFKLFSSPFSICMIIPAALCVILLSILYGELPSIIFSFISALVVFNATDWEFVPFLYILCTSLFATAIVRKIQKRIDIIFVSILLAVAEVFFCVIIAVIKNESLSSLGITYFGVALNGFVSGLLTLGLLTPLELMLNTASVFRLMDLSDLNNAFMQNMLVQASGTYQHSMMVAQLSENACREIGANPLVARVGAYYHDIGKIDQSEYFVENQKGENKHNDINPSLSVSVIRSHVKRGVEKARQLHLPQVIIDIIAEHHGNSVIA